MKPMPFERFACRTQDSAMATDRLANRNPFRFGTKAETLERLQGLLRDVVIPDFWYFSLGEWRSSPASILETIADRFCGVALAVRSSAVVEDGAVSSMAGAFLSRLQIDSKDRGALTRAVEQVA